MPWRRPFVTVEEIDERALAPNGNPPELVLNDTHYVVERAGNTVETSYQDACGAPVEKLSPLGYAVGPATIFFLNLSTTVGIGIFATPSTVLNGTGSIGLSLIIWSLGFFTSITAFAVYLEFTAYFPSRSGAVVVYLEQAFPRPRWLFPTTFAFQSVLLSFSSGNAYAMAQYIFKMTDHSPTDWQIKGVAVASYTLLLFFALMHNRFSYWIINILGVLKIGTLCFIAITGFVVLGGHTRIQDPTANFRNAFEGTATAYGVTNAFYKIIYSYNGFDSAFNVVNEVRDPVKQIKTNGTLSIITVSVLYMLTIIAYYAAASKSEIVNSKLTVANLLFVNVFGNSRVVKGLNFLIVLSVFGNMLAVLVGHGRVIRECGRQGVLPYTKFWVSTWPFGTPLGPFLFIYSITILMILAPPAGDAFNFVADLHIYPFSFFSLLMTVGLLIVRHRRKKLNLPPPSFKAWDVVVYFTILKNLFLLVMPWYPPAGGANGGDVSFWYGTYIVTSIGILIACGIYHWLWITGIPRMRGYKIRQEMVELPDGSSSNRLAKVPIASLEDWDRTHDHAGRVIHVDRAGTPELDHDDDPDK